MEPTRCVRPTLRFFVLSPATNYSPSFLSEGVQVTPQFTNMRKAVQGEMVATTRDQNRKKNELFDFDLFFVVAPRQWPNKLRWP